MSFWQTRKIRLREAEPDDAEAYQEWRLDSDAMRMLGMVHPPAAQSWLKHLFDQRTTSSPEDDSYRYIIENNDKDVVGAITTLNADRRVGVFAYEVYIAPDHRRKGYASDAIGLVLRYFFEELRYQKVNVALMVENEAAQKLHEKLGFLMEGHLRRMAFTQGKFSDNQIWGLLDEEWEAKFPHPERIHEQNGKKPFGFK